MLSLSSCFFFDVSFFLFFFFSFHSFTHGDGIFCGRKIKTCHFFISITWRYFNFDKSNKWNILLSLSLCIDLFFFISKDLLWLDIYRGMRSLLEPTLHKKYQWINHVGATCDDSKVHYYDLLSFNQVSLIRLENAPESSKVHLQSIRVVYRGRHVIQ